MIEDQEHFVTHLKSGAGTRFYWETRNAEAPRVTVKTIETAQEKHILPKSNVWPFGLYKSEFGDPKAPKHRKRNHKIVTWKRVKGVVIRASLEDAPWDIEHSDIQDVPRRPRSSTQGRPRRLTALPTASSTSLRKKTKRLSKIRLQVTHSRSHEAPSRQRGGGETREEGQEEEVR